MKETIHSPTRLAFLDMLRGVTAVGVMLTHCLIMNEGALKNGDAAFSYRNLFLFAIQRSYDLGHSAVIVFFTLSGFVLSCSLLERATPYKDFVIKRLFRICPVFLFVILYSFALHHLVVLNNAPTLPSVRYLLSHTDPSYTLLAKHLLMFGTQGDSVLDPPIWTVVHEMRISLLFPLLLLGLTRYRWRLVTACFFVSCLCSLANLHVTGRVTTGVLDATVFTTFLSTGYFIFFFACGAFLGLKQDYISGALARLAPFKKTALLIISLCCLIKPSIDGHRFAGIFTDYISMLGALGLIALAAGIRQDAAAARHRILLWFGYISYSLYLVHMVVLFIVNAVNEVLGEKLSFWMVDIVVIALSLLVADCITRTIEQPMMAAGKRLRRLSISGLRRGAQGTTNQA